MKQLLFSWALLLLVNSCKSDKNEDQEKDKLEKVPQEQHQEKTALEKSIKRGQAVYADLCVTCHLPGGQGVPGTYPPLNGSNWLSEKRHESIAAVKYGLSGEIIVNGKTYDNMMTPMGLSNQEIADVMNYVMNSWENKLGPMVTEEEVQHIEKN
ncbi:c-type cytochrome [Salegentibacter sp. F14]